MAEITVGDILNSLTEPERRIVYSVLALAYDEPISYKYYCAFNLMSKEKKDLNKAYKAGGFKNEK